MKNTSKRPIILTWILSAIKSNSKETLIWVFAVFAVYVLVEPNSILLSINSYPSDDIPEVVTEVKTFHSTYPKILIFVYQYQNRGKGKLIAIDTEKALVEREWRVLSGDGGNESQMNSGPLPTTKNLDLDHYRVSLQAIRFTSFEIDGYFYQISPISFYINDVKRGGFSIYPNHKVPGTLKDIKILTDPDWDSFQALMRSYEKAGVNYLPLIVISD